MAVQNFLMLFSVGLSLELVLAAILPTQVQAQLSFVKDTTTPGGSTVSVTFEPPGKGTPRDTVGGASRGGGREDATATDSRIAPLIPANNDGLTVAEHPTFFVYVPQTSAQKAVFVLKDEKEDYYYEKTIAIPRTGGVIGLRLPTDAPGIEIGKNYKWSFLLICSEAMEPGTPAVEGKIRRVETNSVLLSQTKNLSPIERAALYGKNGIWYDTLTSIAEQRRLQPNDSTLAATWENLLKSAGLEAIASKPLIQ